MSDSTPVPPFAMVVGGDEGHACVDGVCDLPEFATATVVPAEDPVADTDVETP